MKRSEFRALIREEIKRVLTESSSIASDPVLKKYGFVRLDTPDSIKGKAARSSDFKGVTNVAFFDHTKWGLPTEPFAHNAAKRKIMRTLEAALSKHLGGVKVKSIWDETNANVPANYTVYALRPGKTAVIAIDNGNVDGSDRKVTGTYNGKPFRLETADGQTSIYIAGRMVSDGSPRYDEILNAVNDGGYELEW